VAAELATLKQKLTAAEARIRQIEDKGNAFKPFTSWKSDKTAATCDARAAKSTPTLDDMRERMAALLREMNNPEGQQGA
jgi:hypothetical protein